MEIIIGRSTNFTGIFLRSFSVLQKTKTLTNLRCLCPYDHKKWNFTFSETKLQHRTLTKCFLPRPSSLQSIANTRHVSVNKYLLVKFSSKTENETKHEPTITSSKLNVFQKMKQLAKDYWHILIPVHILTSTCWVSIFYVAAINGVDVIGLMEYIHMPEKYIDMIKNSGAGHWAVVYALYKIFTPIRYTVTVGGTTMTIKYLDEKGYMKFKLPSSKTMSSTKSSATSEKTSDTSMSTSGKQQSEN
ncbi:uncharacterized protein C18orf19 homolog A [Chelonus insularis]|uniref:uncharacterized protein C18orf19 homolog A n=1 Tax=Chelonus insularis TaxID=460826 RepID=UPI00158CFA64|nr:uncharacterized protein C18orf19 homolog A [Chelonus insularis]